MTAFRAYRLHQANGKVISRLETLTLDDLSAGEVVIKVSYSSINYKDALAATGAGKILRKFPLVAGIDLAGEVVSSSAAQFHAGEKVVVTGGGLSETHDGGYSEYARVSSDLVIPIPPGLDEYKCMVLGTAGFTAALAVHRMEHNGQLPERGEIAVTGATGGVGSLAINMLAGRGYDVVAVTAKAQRTRYLKMLGAKRILMRSDLTLSSRPLETALWAGAVDNLGGEVLSWLTRTVDIAGNIASVGLAGGMELNTTVAPFILRGVNLLGINSVHVTSAVRQEIWTRLATDLKPRHLDVIGGRTVELHELDAAFGAYLKGAITGRTVVKIGA
jgi:acrylyl-CoA reductase (NADPH)